MPQWMYSPAPEAVGSGGGCTHLSSAPSTNSDVAGRRIKVAGGSDAVARVQGFAVLVRHRVEALRQLRVLADQLLFLVGGGGPKAPHPPASDACLPWHAKAQ